MPRRDKVSEDSSPSPTPGCGSGVRLARYLQQVQLGHEAPWQMEEAVPNVREGYRHDRPARPRTRYAIAVPHRPVQGSTPTGEHNPPRSRQARASEPENTDRSRPPVHKPRCCHSPISPPGL